MKHRQIQSSQIESRSTRNNSRPPTLRSHGHDYNCRSQRCDLTVPRVIRREGLCRRIGD
jgi:hypothetical protein